MSPVPKLTEVPEELPDDVDELKGLLRKVACERQMLASAMEKYLRERFGTSSERLRTQADLFVSEAQSEAAVKDAPSPDKPAQVRPRGHGRKRPAEHLERRRVVHDIAEADKCCSRCHRQRPLIGQSVSEQIDYQPASVFVTEHVTLTYGECSCGCVEAGGVLEASKPLQPIDKGLAGPGLLAYVATSKYADHLPLYRIERILARHGLDVERSTLWGWIWSSGQVIKPLVDLMHREIICGQVINSDDTLMPVQASGKVHKARLWVYVGDPDHPYVFYDFRLDRSRAGPLAVLGGYKGYLQVDAYKGYDVVLLDEGAMEAGCWAHVRRKFFNASQLGCKRSEQALVDFIQPLYRVEREGKGLGRDDLEALRQEKAVPILEEFFEWAQAQQLQVLPESPVGKALFYALDNRKALCRYTEHGYLGIDNNTSERGMRPVVIGRKNWLFTGSERGGKAAALFFSVIESAKRQGLDVFSYLKDLFTRLPSHPHNRISDFLPDRWQPQPTR